MKGFLTRNPCHCTCLYVCMHVYMYMYVCIHGAHFVVGLVCVMAGIGGGSCQTEERPFAAKSEVHDKFDVCELCMKFDVCMMMYIRFYFDVCHVYA
jgi:hypothetical protein